MLADTHISSLFRAQSSGVTRSVSYHAPTSNHHHHLLPTKLTMPGPTCFSVRPLACRARQCLSLPRDSRSRRHQLSWQRYILSRLSRPRGGHPSFACSCSVASQRSQSVSLSLNMSYHHAIRSLGRLVEDSIPTNYNLTQSHAPPFSLAPTLVTKDKGLKNNSHVKRRC